MHPPSAPCLHIVEGHARLSTVTKGCLPEARYTEDESVRWKLFLGQGVIGIQQSPTPVRVAGCSELVPAEAFLEHRECP